MIIKMIFKTVVTRVAATLWIPAAAFAADPIEALTSAIPTAGSVVVIGAREYSRPASLLGARGDMLDAPLSMSVIAADALAEPGSLSIASVLARVPSVGENFATSGYYENFTVRGFTLDLGTSYRINGFVVPGEFHIPLDMVDSVEVLKGVAGPQGGLIGAGGSVNFVTRRSDGPNVVRAEVSQRGGIVTAADLAYRLGTPGDTGLRLGAAHAEMRPNQPAADGQRDLLSLAVDTRLRPGLLIMADLIAQRRSQQVVPGFQLLGGTTLPDSKVRDVNINRQPWSRPVTNEGVMADLRLSWQIAEGLAFQAGAASTVAMIDDNLATPWGCNTSPVQYFCSNGDFVLYDYHARERRAGRHLTASISAATRSGAVAHALALGVERVDRSVRQDNLYSATIYDAIGNGLVQNIATTATPLEAPIGMGINRPATRAIQSGAVLSDNMSLGGVSVLVGLRAVGIDQQPSGAREHHLLPQFAVTWAPTVGQSLYVSRARGVEFGSEAPLTASNAGALLAPRRTNQTEAGWKGHLSAGAAWTVSAFRMVRPYEFTQPVGGSWAGLGDYVSSGSQVHDGLEVSYQSTEKLPLRFEASAAYIRARATGTGVSALENVQIQNVPRLSSFVRVIHAPSITPGLEYSLSWTHRGLRNARRDGAATVPEYDLLNLGLSWKTRIASTTTVLALSVKNLADRRYWRDVGEAYSADLLFPGAPRSVAASASLEF